MAGHPPEEQALGVTAAVRLPRLTAPRPVNAPPPTFADLGMTQLHKVCKSWQFERAGSTFWELNIRGRPDSWREIPVLMGSTAESALLAGTACVEVECLRQAIAAGDLPREYGLAQRFFAEAQGHLILGCGHRLANIALRVMMLARGYPWGVGVRLRQPITPFSDNRDDWVAMAEMPDFRRAAIASPYRSLDRLTSVVIDLAGSRQWSLLDRQRASEFHRGRQESPFVSGARQSSVWVVQGQTRTLEPLDDVPSAVEVDHWLADLGKESIAALAVLPRFMRKFHAALADAMEEITDGTFHMGSP